MHYSISRVPSWRGVRGFCSSANNLVSQRALLDKIGTELGITEVIFFTNSLQWFIVFSVVLAVVFGAVARGFKERRLEAAQILSFFSRCAEERLP